jgi:hypothetical protein
VIVAALSVSACAPPAPAKPPKASPSNTALFASDEEALAAAEEAYREYQHVSDAILIDGGADPERLLEVATQAQYEYEKAGYDKILAANERGVGASKFDSMKLHEPDGESAASESSILAVTVCDDYSDVEILDGAGNSVVSPNRPDRFPRVASFAQSKSAKLVVASVTERSGETFC